MLIIIDKRIPDSAKESLSKFGSIIEFSTQTITYDALSGHPDIFLCQTPEILICAPNLPENYFALFDKKGISYIVGKNNVGSKFPETSFYNCVVNDKFIFHKKTNTDKSILEQTKQLEFINLPQAYTRCNLMSLSSETYITSDKGIEKTMRNHDLDVHYFSPEQILLPTMTKGFIGGAMGLHNEKLFVIGNPDFHSWGKAFKLLLVKQNLELISLYDGSFFDGGGIFFLE